MAHTPGGPPRPPHNPSSGAPAEGRAFGLDSETQQALERSLQRAGRVENAPPSVDLPIPQSAGLRASAAPESGFSERNARWEALLRQQPRRVEPDTEEPDYATVVIPGYGSPKKSPQKPFKNQVQKQARRQPPQSIFSSGEAVRTRPKVPNFFGQQAVSPPIQAPRHRPPRVEKPRKAKAQPSGKVVALPFRYSLGASTLLHLTSPLWGWALLSLLAFLLWALFQIDLMALWPKETPKEREIEFVLVQDPVTKPPENALFKGEQNQEAGGKPDEKKPPSPVEPSKSLNAAQPQQKPTPPKPSPAPSKQPTPAQKPQPQQKQTQPAPKPVAEAKPQPKPEPPKPQMKAPTPKPPQPRLAAPPTIKVPVVAQTQNTSPNDAKQADSAQKALESGPVVRASQGANAAKATTGPVAIAVDLSVGSMSTAMDGVDSSRGQRGNPQAGPGQQDNVAVAMDSFWGPFMADLKRRMRRNWHPPRSSNSNRVVIRFNVHRDGSVGTIEIAESSGSAEGDQAAIDAILVSAPFLKLPPEYNGEYRPIEFTFDHKILRPTF